MTSEKAIMRDKRYREFRKEQIRKFRINNNRDMNVPEHFIFKELIEHLEELKNEEDYDLFMDTLVDTANLCILCYMSNKGFRGR